jgi:hypothetical protein
MLKLWAKQGHCQINGIFAALIKVSMAQIPDIISRPAINRMLRFLLLMGPLMWFVSCANPVAPTGGPRDEEPPQVVRSVPPNYSTHFEGGQVRIFFDEFVALKDLRNKFLISPPLEELPEVRIRGRSIIMNVDEPLLPNTTYNFFFGDAIEDITEGNAMENFQFVVSTGEYVDSLSVQGQILNAFTLEPAGGVFVMMYADPYDSIPYKERPVYLAKTNKEGWFAINNMREGSYMMFALMDLNANFRYDLPEEKIAFVDTLVSPVFLGHPHLEPEPEPEPEHEPDPDAERVMPVMPEAVEELPPDIPDAPEPETDTPAEMPLADARPPGHFTLFLFQEADTVQRIVSSVVPRRGLVEVAFRIPTDSVWVRNIGEPFDHDWLIPEVKPGRDTLRLWLPGVERDSLFVEVNDRERVLDTLRLSLVLRPARGRVAEEPARVLGLSVNASQARGLPFFRPLRITADSPVESWDDSLIQLMKNDTIEVQPGLEFADPVRRVIRTDDLLEPATQYQLTILPGAITNVFGLTNDTLNLRFRTTPPEDYGTLMLVLDLPHENNPFLLQLLDRDGRALEEKTIYEPGTDFFHHLAPGNYGLRLIDDVDRSGQWTTGHYLQGRQPEPVYIFTEPIQLRANWEMEISWSPSPRQ